MPRSGSGGRWSRSRRGACDDFFGLAATQIRRELIDLARHYFGPQGRARRATQPGWGRSADGTTAPPYEGIETTYDPSRLAAWTEFHRAVEGLPDDERELFELLWYLGLPQDDGRGFWAWT